MEDKEGAAFGGARTGSDDGAVVIMEHFIAVFAQAGTAPAYRGHPGPERCCPWPAQRRALPWPDVASLRSAYEFDCLQSFLDLYYLGASVPVTEQDFLTSPGPIWSAAPPTRWCTWRSSSIPRTHTARGIAFETVLGA